MSNKKLILTILFLGIIFALVGLLLAMNATGVFDIRTALADLPVIGQRFAVEEELLIVKPLEEENFQLRQEIELLKKAIAEKEQAAGNVNAEISKYTARISALEEQITKLEARDLQSAQLATYYSKMEDRQAVRIFDNLDDRTVLDILVKLPPDKAAGFLAAMDPMRAAKLTAVLTDRTSSAGN